MLSTPFSLRQFLFLVFIKLVLNVQPMDENLAAVGWPL